MSSGMSNGNTPRDEAELEAYLAGDSPLSTAYRAIDTVEPPEVLDAKILALARAGAKPGTSPAKPKPVPSATVTAAAVGSAAPPKPVAVPAPAARPADLDDDDDDDDAPVARRPRWLVPAALAATVLIAVGVGVATLQGNLGFEPGADSSNPLGSLFARRARLRSETDKAAADAAAAASAAAEVEVAPLLLPPVFEPEGPQVEDLEKAIVLIRRELVMANQLAATAEEAAAEAKRAEGQSSRSEAAKAASPSGAVAAADPASEPEVVQPRNRRLAKILQLYDDVNPDLAAASLEMFLRDFEDDPISRRIIDAQPRATDVAVQ
ncbi:MAG: hypothetical protein ABIX37_00115 [Gammaproteobacteria bacterium]